MDIGVLIIIAVIVFWQSGAFGSARERNKKATLSKRTNPFQRFARNPSD